MAQDQQHPQEKRDRQVVNSLLGENSNDYNLAELARLRIRYRNFPGARQMHQDLDLILQQWQLTEEKLFEQTREIHTIGKVYRRKQG
ncbi:MAG: DUF3288 family protein, partial [Cyanobacteria bacterium P01_G01_bin.49]